MKKLIVFAAVAALGLSAMAKDLCTEDEELGSCALWDVKLTLKTLQTDKKQATIKQKDSCSDTCSECYMLKDVTRKFKGVLWQCATVCINEGDEVNFVLWDTKNKVAVSKPLVTGTGTYEADTLTFTQLGLYTKKANKVVAFWTKEFSDTGFGTVWAAGTKGSITTVGGETLLKSISGNAVGLLNPSYIVSSKCEDPVTVVGKIIGICDCFDDICSSGTDATLVAASGTWSIKYNKKLSKGTKTLASIVPSYAQERSSSQP